jgi:hypothetical protein
LYKDRWEAMEANLKIIARENEGLHEKLKKQVMKKLKQIEEGTFDLAEAFPTEEWYNFNCVS